MSKNIVIFSDGTGQKGGKGYDSNVYKLFNMVENRTKRQIAFYDPGIGTDWRTVAGLVAGAGFSHNLLDCYTELHNVYEAGDRIFLFGFSRGAATVRSLTGFLHLFGILPRSRPDLIREAFKIYKITNTEKREKKAAEFVDRHHTMWCRVAFLGCWDTVSALGFPLKGINFFIDRFFKHKFHSFDLSATVEYARHALAMDDHRKTFHPVMWKELPMDSAERLKQVWFCGSHTDVGGGYKEVGLSNIALTWMLKEAVEKGLLIYSGSPALRKLKENPAGNVNDKMNDEQASFPGSLFRTENRSKLPKNYGKPVFHSSVFERQFNQANQPGSKYSSELLDGLNRDDYIAEPWTKDLSFLDQVRS